MADYNYKEGKKRVKDILNNKLEVIEQNKLPADEKFTFDNGYYSWVSAVFVDICKSTALFSNGDKEKISKIIRCFTSEIIDILRDDDNNREIGIRGDCVYAIYTTPTVKDIYKIADKTFYINTFMKMLKKLLIDKKYPSITAGIGMATAQELVVKAGRKDTGINNKVWIGKAVTKASNLSSLGNRNNVESIVISKCSYNSIIKYKPTDKSLYQLHPKSEFGAFYGSNATIKEFNNWINNGMKDYNFGLEKLTF